MASLLAIGYVGFQMRLLYVVCRLKHIPFTASVMALAVYLAVIIFSLFLKLEPRSKS